MLSIHDIRHSGNKANSQHKDLQRLNRQDLLELLVGQMHEGDSLRATIARKDRRIEEHLSLIDRLKEKLNLKDEQIEHLKEKLDLKDEQIDHLKGKLNLKDVQIEHLKGKLDDKDATFEKLKARLDAKDSLIARLSESHHISQDDWDIFEARARVSQLEEASAEAENEE